MTTEPEAVQLGRRMAELYKDDTTDDHEDVYALARAVLDQHAEIEQLRDAVEALARIASGWIESSSNQRPEARRQALELVEYLSNPTASCSA